MDIKTVYNNKSLILKDVYNYNGIITLQYLPNGGIQMIRNDEMIINYNNGFVATKLVNYDGVDYNIKEFSKIFPNLVNQVLQINN